MVTDGDAQDVLLDLAQKVGRRWVSHTVLALQRQKGPLRRKEIAEEISHAARERVSDTQLTRTIAWLLRHDLIASRKESWYKLYDLTPAGRRHATELQQLVQIYQHPHRPPRPRWPLPSHWPTLGGTPS